MARAWPCEILDSDTLTLAGPVPRTMARWIAGNAPAARGKRQRNIVGAIEPIPTTTGRGPDRCRADI